MIERFIVSAWLRMNWPGDPDVADIVRHTERLAPDADVFFKSLRACAREPDIERLIRRSIGELIAADGRICPAEMDWASEVDTFFKGIEDAEYQQFLTAEAGFGVSLSIEID